MKALLDFCGGLNNDLPKNVCILFPVDMLPYMIKETLG